MIEQLFCSLQNKMQKFLTGINKNKLKKLPESSLNLSSDSFKSLRFAFESHLPTFKTA